MMWMDTRGGPQVLPPGRRPRGRVRAPAAGASGSVVAVCRPRPTGDDPLGHMLYLEHDRPEVAARARWYLEPVDYLSMRFTGVAAASPAIDDRGLADRHPAARHPGLRPGAGPPRRCRPGQAAAAASDRLGRRHRAAERGRASSASPAGVQS